MNHLFFVNNVTRLQKSIITLLISLVAMFVGIFLSYVIFIPFRNEFLYGGDSIVNKIGHFKLGIYLFISLLPVFVLPLLKRVSALFSISVYLLFLALFNLNPLTLVLLACAFYRECM